MVDISWMRLHQIKSELLIVSRIFNKARTKTFTIV